MNLKMYIPFYGTYLQSKRMLSPEAADRPFSERAADAVFTGMISGLQMGVMAVHFPKPWAPPSLFRYSVAAASNPFATIGMTAPVALAVANFSVIEAAPEEEQRGLWQMFSSALTGTFGGDYSTLI